MTTLVSHYHSSAHAHHQDPRRQSPPALQYYHHHHPSDISSSSSSTFSSPTTTSQQHNQHLHTYTLSQSHPSQSSSAIISDHSFNIQDSPPPSQLFSSQSHPSTITDNISFDYATTVHDLNSTPINFSTPMQSANSSGSWNFASVSNGQLTPTSARTPRNTHHHRESSLSSIGSAGPSSPYNSSTTNPQIILSDNDNSYYDGLAAVDGYQSYSKPLTHHNPTDFLYGYNDYSNNSNLAAFMALQRQQQDIESMPAPDHSHAKSVASANDSPSTPESNIEYKSGEFFSRSWLASNSPFSVPKLERGMSDIYSSVPKLDRTMSDAYNDELYSPNFAFTSAPTSKPKATTVSPSQNDVFTQRLQAANNQHLSATSRSPVQNSRQLSPFRQGSPLAPTHDSFGSASMRLGSAQQLREQQKAENDALVLAQQIKRSSPRRQAEEKTISPKDALLDYHGNDDASEMPLFPPSATPQYRAPTQQPQQLKTEPSVDMDDSGSQQSFRSMATSREDSGAYSSSSQTTPQQTTFSFAPPSVPGVQIPQQYPFVPQSRREQSDVSGVSGTPDFPSTLTSMESSSSEYTPDNKLQKPAGTLADAGTYTCTYHGCTLRFETPAKLQKHKREGHRQSAPLGRASGSPDGMTSAVNRNSQAGPHKCERINPSTGKPCNTVFSRPYDLTRHEDTIVSSIDCICNFYEANR